MMHGAYNIKQTNYLRGYNSFIWKYYPIFLKKYFPSQTCSIFIRTFYILYRDFVAYNISVLY